MLFLVAVPPKSEQTQFWVNTHTKHTCVRARATPHRANNAIVLHKFLFHRRKCKRYILRGARISFIRKAPLKRHKYKYIHTELVAYGGNHRQWFFCFDLTQNKIHALYIFSHTNRIYFRVAFIPRPRQRLKCTQQNVYITAKIRIETQILRGCDERDLYSPCLTFLFVLVVVAEARNVCQGKWHPNQSGVRIEEKTRNISSIPIWTRRTQHINKLKCDVFQEVKIRFYFALDANYIFACGSARSVRSASVAMRDARNKKTTSNT